MWKLLWTIFLVAKLSTCYADASGERNKRAILNNPQSQGYLYDRPSKPLIYPAGESYGGTAIESIYPTTPKIPVTRPTIRKTPVTRPTIRKTPPPRTISLATYDGYTYPTPTITFTHPTSKTLSTTKSGYIYKTPKIPFTLLPKTSPSPIITSTKGDFNLIGENAIIYANVRTRPTKSTPFSTLPTTSSPVYTFRPTVSIRTTREVAPRTQPYSGIDAQYLPHSTERSLYSTVTPPPYPSPIYSITPSTPPPPTITGQPAPPPTLPPSTTRKVGYEYQIPDIPFDYEDSVPLKGS